MSEHRQTDRNDETTVAGDVYLPAVPSAAVLERIERAITGAFGAHGVVRMPIPRRRRRAHPSDD